MCQFKQANGGCTDGMCIPEKSTSKCCADCKAVSCQYRCDQSQKKEG